MQVADRGMSLAGLRVGIVGPLPPPAGGMAGQTAQLAELLAAEGALPVVVQANAPYRPAWVASLPGVRAAFRLAGYLPALWRTAGEVDLLHVMANSGWSWHLVAAPAVWAGSLRGVPVVVNYRGGEADPFLRRARHVVRPTLARAAALAVPSRFLAEVFARHGFDSTVLPNIVDTTRFAPSGVAADRKSAPHLFVARNLERIYDVATALRAFARIRAAIPAATISIAGSGPERAALNALADSLGIAAAVRFTGQVDRDGMAALYRSADLVLNPSLVDNMPNSILEALACGVPVVSTDVGGVPYVVQHERTALLVKSGDDAAMAAAALSLLQQRERAAALVRAGLAEVQRYTWANVRGVLADLYRDVLRMRAAQAPAT
jgi:glycosyltransferase involved in cell wall biosynthesis